MGYLHNDKEQFLNAIYYTKAKNNIPVQMIEKDYYVTLILRFLAERIPYVVFKGGTSLSKCHKVINRFSEDIDITIDISLSQGQKKKLKQIIVEIADMLGMHVTNLDNTRSRRDYNRYIIEYNTAFPVMEGVLKNEVLIETSFTTVAFPTITIPVDNYIGDLMRKENSEWVKKYNMDSFNMKVQSLDRTLVDKVFAICDYYLQNRIEKYSRHIYDIYKLLPRVPLNGEFAILVKEVREIRKKTSICPSAQDGIDISELLERIITEEVYKDDYINLTEKLIAENVSYNEAIVAVRAIIINSLF